MSRQGPHDLIRESQIFGGKTDQQHGDSKFIWKYDVQRGSPDLISGLKYKIFGEYCEY